MKTRLTISGVDSYVPSAEIERTVLSEVVTADVISEFDVHRFYHWQPTPEVAIICGSTYARIKNLDHLTPPVDMVLDATSFAYRYDARGVFCGMVLAISDGQGHGIDHQESQLIAQTARYNCDQFTQSFAQRTNIDVSELQQKIHQINAESRDNLFNYDGTNRRSGTLTGVVLDYDLEACTWRASVVNVGDSLMIILDGETGALKFSTTARAFEQWKNTFAPKGVQEIDGFSEAVTCDQFEVVPGDVMIQMSDGIWGEFPHLEKNINITQKGTRCREDRVSCSPISLDAERDVHDIATNILRVALESTLKKRYAFLDVVQDSEFICAYTKIPIFSSAKEEDAYTLQQWITDTQCSAGLIKKIEIIYSMSNHDSTEIIGSYLQAPAMHEIRAWQAQIGDCSTLQVLRVPDYTHMLLRRLIEKKYSLLMNLPFETIPIEQASTPMELTLTAYIQAIVTEYYVPDLSDESRLRYTELRASKQQPWIQLQELTIHHLLAYLTPDDLPSVKAIIASGLTAQEKEERQHVFEHYIAHAQLSQNFLCSTFFSTRSEQPSLPKHHSTRSCIIC